MAPRYSRPVNRPRDGISKFFESSQGLGGISSKNQPMQQMISTSLTSNQPVQTSVRNGSTPLIRLTDLSKIFVTDEVETHAVSGVHLDVRDGEYVSIPGLQASAKLTWLPFWDCLV